MHPILADRGTFALYLFACLVFGFMLAALIAIPGGTEWAAAILFSVPMVLIYGLMALSSWYVCRSAPLKTTTPFRLVAVFSIAAFLSSALWILVGKGFVLLLSNGSIAVDLADHYSAHVPLLFGTGTGLYLFSVAVHYLMIAFEDSKDSERRALELTILAQSAELRALRSQINPHFLFNSLNSISALTSKDPTAARTMLLLLADFLRQTLQFATENSIALREELSLCDKFLEIERVRFGSRLAVIKNIPDATVDYLVPPLILQPLIENAINHGIAHLVGGGQITLAAEVRGRRVHIRIQNPCDPDRPKTKGSNLGLQNVSKRLKTLSESETRLDVSEDNGIFSVEVTLPAVQS